MNIGDVAKASGLPAKTIRYYEEIGLVRPARTDNGYRAFGPHDVDMLAFLGRARSLGLSIEECRTLLLLYENPNRSSADVKAVAAEHMRQIDDKIVALERMRSTLGALMARCRGDDQPDCAILASLSGTEAVAPTPSGRKVPPQRADKPS